MGDGQWAMGDGRGTECAPRRGVRAKNIEDVVVYREATAAASSSRFTWAVHAVQRSKLAIT